MGGDLCCAASEDTRLSIRLANDIAMNRAFSGVEAFLSLCQGLGIGLGVMNRPPGIGGMGRRFC